jgi:DNA-dependent RNA polymerase
MMTEKPRDLSAPEKSDGPLRSFEGLGAALGRDCANVTRLEESPVLDTEAATRAKVEKSPYSVQKVGRETLKLWIEPLAAYLAQGTSPRGLKQVLQGLDHKQLAFLALRSILDQIHFGWDKRRDRRSGKRTVKNPDMLFRVELGQAVRDELDFAGLLAAKRYVKAARNKHAAIGRLKFRRIDWTRAECAQVGDWLWDALAQMTCFDADERGFPGFHSDHKAALDKLAEEVLFDHPLYKPKLAEPPPWTAWRMECPGDIGATFVKATDPETIETVRAAFVTPAPQALVMPEESPPEAVLLPGETPDAFYAWFERDVRPQAAPISVHARAVSAIQSVPLKINPAMLSLVREFAGEEHRRDVVVAEALANQPRFYNRVRCDRRGRLIQICDFNYTRGDPVRSLFMFAEGKPLGQMGVMVAGQHAGWPIDWLEIAIANAHGVKGTWADRHKWVADNHELIKAVSVDPGLIWRQGVRAKEPFQFAAACIEYVAADMHGPTYETHLPVWLDASSNGLQHLAIMMRDVKLAEMVNLKVRTTERGPAIQDAYDVVTAYARQNLCADGDDPSIWLSHNLAPYLRDLLKQPIMTLPYGVTRSGMLDQIKETCAELGINVPFAALVRLRDHIWRAIEEALPGAMAARTYIQGIAQHCLDRGAYMQWVTPSGFPVDNRYRKSHAHRVRLPFLGQSVTIADGYTDEPRAQKTIDSAVANFTHSLDAAHLALSVNAAVDRGITNIMTIHDCFGALAPDVHHFGQIRRWELAKMALYNPLAVLRATNLPSDTNDLPLPAFDPAFDRVSLGESEYFDR